MKVFRIIISAMCIIMMTSCTSSMWFGKEFKVPEKPKQIQKPNFKENIYEHTKILSTESKDIDLHNDMIKLVAESMRSASVESMPSLDEIHSLADTLDSVVNNNINSLDKIQNSIEPLIDISYELTYLDMYIDNIEKQNNEILEENRNLRNTNAELTDKVYILKSDEQAWYSKLWIAIAILGLIIILLGVIMIKTMPKTGISHIGGGILLISLALFAQKYAWAVAILGGVGLVSSIGIFIYMVFIHKKAIRENSIVGERLKNKDWSNTEEIKKEFNIAHSNSTKDLFSKEKQYLKKKGIL